MLSVGMRLDRRTLWRQKQRKGLSFEQIAAHAKLHERTVRRIFHGQADPRPRTVGMIWEALSAFPDLPGADLFTLAEPDPCESRALDGTA